MVLTFKFVVSLALLVLLLVSKRFDLGRLRSRQFTLLSWSALASIRFIVFCMIYVVLNLNPQSDMIGYFSEAKDALNGGLIYRDFESSYGPIFTYMDAVVVYLWHSPKSIILFAIVLELASFPLWLCVARGCFDEGTVRTAALLYILSPIPFFATGVSGLNQSLGAAYLALVILLLMSRREGLAGFVMGMAIPGVKFLMVLFSPIAWVFSRHKTRFLVGFCIPVIAVYGTIHLLGADLTVPFKIQVNDQTSGNLPFLLGLVGLDAASPGVSRLFDCMTAIALALVFLIHAIRTRTEQASWVVHMCSIIGLTFMLFSKKSYTTYLVLFYFPLCISVAKSGFSLASAAQFGVFNLVATLEPSLLFRWVLNSSTIKNPSLAYLSMIHRNSVFISVIFLVVNLALVSSYCRLLIGIWRVMLQDRSERERAVPEVQFA